MGLIKAHQEPIEMTSRRYGYFPRTFLWKGKEYSVETVSRCWTTGNKTMNRHYFEVSCRDEKFTLFQDIKCNSWFVEV